MGTNASIYILLLYQAIFMTVTTTLNKDLMQFMFCSHNMLLMIQSQKKTYHECNCNATNTQTYLHSLSRVSQSRPSNKHCGLLHSMSHSPFMNTFQQLIGAEQLRHGLIPSEQSLPSKLHAYELHSSSHCELPDFSLHPLAVHFARCSSKSESIVEIVLVGIRLGLGRTGWPHPARKLGL
jgi:hypothetical protein